MSKDKKAFVLIFSAIILTVILLLVMALGLQPQTVVAEQPATSTPVFVGAPPPPTATPTPTLAPLPVWATEPAE